MIPNKADEGLFALSHAQHTHTDIMPCPHEGLLLPGDKFGKDGKDGKDGCKMAFLAIFDKL